MTKSKHIENVYTDAFVRELKDCYENGMTIKEISKKYHADCHAISTHLKAIGVQISIVPSIAGEKFGRFLIESENKEKFICKCDCGNRVVIKRSYRSKIIRGQTDFCGCTYEVAHKLRQTRLYQTWKSMKARCYNSKNKRYKNYGGKGIVVCDEWLHTFENFYYWSINNGYSDDLTIDRIDNSKGYSPDNCRWADIETQANNHTDNHFLTYNSERLTLAQWAKKMKVAPEVLWKRIDRGWSVEKALTTPLRIKENGHYTKDLSTGIR